jgi:hypothetical protein
MQAVREEDTREKAGDRHGGGRQQIHGDAGSRDTLRQAGAPSYAYSTAQIPSSFTAELHGLTVLPGCGC